MLGLGAGTVAVAGAGGLTWRALESGVFDTGAGPAYGAWDQSKPQGSGSLDMVRAAVLAANAHDTQPWLFRVAANRIDLFADAERNIGTVDPLRREMHPDRAGGGRRALRFASSRRCGSTSVSSPHLCPLGTRDYPAAHAPYVSMSFGPTGGAAQ
jgi:hypothetical protein